MFQNYLKTLIRIFSRNRLFMALNLLGLSVGLVCFILIQLYVYYETSFDRHHPDSDRLYRMAMKGDMSGFSFEAAVMGGPLGGIMQDEIPEVIEHTTFYHMPRPILIQKRESRIYQEHILFVDSCFLDVFGYEIIAGDPGTMLNAPYSMVLTETMARKFFGDENPIGQQINWNNTSEYTVTGLIRDSQYNSHLNFEVLASFNSLLEQDLYRNLLTTVLAFVSYNYIVIEENTDLDTLQKKLDEVILKYMGESMEATGSHFELFLQPVTDIHLNSNLVHELEPNSSITRVYIFAAISLLILIIACINYINLNVARSSERAFEIGLRKVIGAGRRDLFIQFISESILITLLSLLIALLLLGLLLPWFYNFSGIRFYDSLFSKGIFYLLLAGLLIVGIISGIYPALHMSGIKTIRVLKGISASGRSRSLFRNVMIIFQLVISVFLIFSTIVIRNQLELINTRDIGVDRENLITIPLRSSQMTSHLDVLREEISAIAGVQEVSFFSAYLGSFEQRRGFWIDDQQRDDMWMLHYINVSQNYLDVMKIRLMQGRNFRPGSRADSNAVIINRALVEQAGWDEPLGRIIVRPEAGQEIKYEVIGVCDNFNYASVHTDVEALLIFLDPPSTGYMGVRVQERDMTAALSAINEKWDDKFSAYPFDYFIQEDFYNDLYKEERKMGDLFIYFAFLAVLIASMGLFGLIIFITARRTKEIAIHKVLGGSVWRVTWIMLKDLIWWILIASAVGWTGGYFFTRDWLQNFIYQTGLNWWIYLLSSVIVLIISLLTIGFQSLRAARANPVDSLSYE